MNRKERIESALAALGPTALEVVDESNRHKNGRESHYNLTVVSAAFEGQSRVARHRRIHELLAAELSTGLHAVTLTLRTPAEAAADGSTLASPSCQNTREEPEQAKGHSSN